MPRFETLADWLYWQESLHPRKIDPGLERVAALTGRMALRRPGRTIVSVAGTNGKGSSVAMLEAILLAAGYRVGSYTSPHLLSYNERIRINGREVSDAALCAAFAQIDAQRAGQSLSYFEFGTLAAFMLLQQAAPDIAILEVGLGGRLDAVNCVDADIALITAIGLDHMQWLGNDRESIGREKAGIARRGKPAVCSDPAAPASLAVALRDAGARRYALNEHFSRTAGTEGWNWLGPEHCHESLPLPRMAGAHQLDNAAGVLMVLDLLREILPVTKTAICQGLGSACLPGRCQWLPGAVEIVLDVAHNTQSASRLLASLRERSCRGRTRLVLGMLEDKDVRGYTTILAPAVDTWYLAGLAV
ncbi:MAG: bifunctional tetrahydrofolate synthase/dihydrofolate synthase, partial [Gammaproteobacteria bacterium]